MGAEAVNVRYGEKLRDRYFSVCAYEMRVQVVVTKQDSGAQGLIT